jgi:hypothetical protein
MILQTGWRALLAALAFMMLLLPAQARSGARTVDVELVLAVDVSYSMDQEEQRLQRMGYISALTSPEFLKALASGPHNKIAVAYMEWAGAGDQKIIIDWTLIDGAASAQAFAEKLFEAPYRRASRTSIAGAIDMAMQMFIGNGFAGLRRVIDISGDGPNNSGRLVTLARDAAVADGTTINGLPLIIRPVRPAYMDIADLDLYYQDCVIGGPGAFMIPIRDAKGFAEATRTKLVLEIATRPTQDAPAIHKAQSKAPRVSCTIGEALWQQRMGN